METWLLLALIYLVLMLGLFAGGARIAIAMGTVGMLALYIQGGTRNLLDVGWACYNTFHSFVLVAIPLFLLMGQFLIHGTLIEKIYWGMESWIHRLPGGLLISNIFACTVFAAISGSSAATAATIGQISIPPLRRLKYKPSHIYGSIAGGGTLGILIPPSLNMIVYGSITGTSVGHLFMAGVFPGSLLSALFSIFIIVRARLRGSSTEIGAKERAYTWRARISALPLLIPVALLITMVMGSIYSGIATPTEAAGVGALGALLIAIVFRECSWKNIKTSLFNTVGTCSWLFLIVGCATILGYGLSRAGITRNLAQVVIDMQLTPIAFVILLMGVYVILGCFLDGFSIMVLTMPVLLPILQGMGIDLVWFGVLIILMTETAMVTPPVGINLFIVQGIAGNVPIREVIEGAIPYAIMLIIAIVLVIAFPEIATWLPNQMK